MASITIRNLDDDVKTRLRIRAAGKRPFPWKRRCGSSCAMRLARGAAPGTLQAQSVHGFAPLGGVELELPPREPAREPPRFE